jgi:hypothetical protein
MTQEFKTPVSLESAVKEITKTKVMIEKEKEKIAEIEENGFEYTGGFNVSDYDSFGELVEALQELIKERGDLKIEWKGDLSIYHYPATEKETKQIIENCKIRILGHYSKISLIQKYVEKEMEKIHSVMESI